MTQDIDLRQAISLSRDAVQPLLGKKAKNLLLEEFAYDEMNARWHVTFGFDRLIEEVGLNPVLEIGIGNKLAKPHKFERVYKTVEIRKSDGQVLSVRMRTIDQAA
jgi:hypothetical protein